MNEIKKQAAKVVDEAGQAGGIDEVRRLAERGWPEARPLDNDSPEFREAIKQAAFLSIAVPEPTR